MRPSLFAFALVACALGVCGCGHDSGPGQAAGACSSQVPAGQACNSLIDVSTPITPTCATGEMPAGVGGAIVDGTYALTEQIYYNQVSCPVLPVGGTILISGSCLQTVNDKWSVTASASISVQGSTITTTRTCVSTAADLSGFTADSPTQTYTATPTTFTVFHLNSAAGNPNPDRIEVFTRR